MPVTVLYFASLREQLGKSEDTLCVTAGITVADIWQQTVAPYYSGAQNVLVAVNREYAGFNTPVREGDEIAFFPPVTGG